MKGKSDAVLIGYVPVGGGAEAKVKLYPGGDLYVGKTYKGTLHNPSPRRAEIWCSSKLDDFRSVL